MDHQLQNFNASSTILFMNSIAIVAYLGLIGVATPSDLTRGSTRPLPWYIRNFSFVYQVNVFMSLSQDTRSEKDKKVGSEEVAIRGTTRYPIDSFKAIICFGALLGHTFGADFMLNIGYLSMLPN